MKNTAMKKNKLQEASSSMFVTLMVHLSSGQSKPITLRKVTYPSELCCLTCWISATVHTPDGKRCVVGECADCALDKEFSDSLGIKLSPNLSLDEFVCNPAQYCISVSSWLEWYCNGANVSSDGFITRRHCPKKVEKLITELMDNYGESDLTTCEPNDIDGIVKVRDVYLCQPADKPSPKLVARVRRRFDELFIEEPDEIIGNRLVRGMEQLDIECGHEKKRMRRKQ